MFKAPPATSMQKTYDECYLICSTAIYFEGQNNEEEALRSWRNALDQIYYHNAYKMPASYVPRTETERALADSLRAMELQCKERVDLLEALKKSREEAELDASGAPANAMPSSGSAGRSTSRTQRGGPSTPTWMGGDTVPPTSYTQLPKPSPTPERRPPPPLRPPYSTKRSSDADSLRTMSLQSTSLSPPPLVQPRARTPSPEKKSGMKKTLRPTAKEKASSSKPTATLRTRPPPAAAKAATQVWSGATKPAPQGADRRASDNPAWDPYRRSLVDRPTDLDRRTSETSIVRPPSPSDFLHPPPYPDYPSTRFSPFNDFSQSQESLETVKAPPPPPPPHTASPPALDKPRPKPPTISDIGPSSISYMKEYPNHPPQRPKPPLSTSKKPAESAPAPEKAARLASPKTVQSQQKPAIPRKAVGRALGVVSARAERQRLDNEESSSSPNTKANVHDEPQDLPQKAHAKWQTVDSQMTPPTSDDSDKEGDANPEAESSESTDWDARIAHTLKHLPKGVDETAAKQILTEIVIKGDEVHWDDVAGLEIAKSALKETVVYPFLRPDLFMGLREPARGMLLFGPPGTGKTMLARAVATESKSVFFAISASSLTSKYLGESEKLVRALFALAKALAPSIIFVDEIDSLLGSRGGQSEHEATRRIKTEFLIQWSDLQKAAAGREDKSASAGDASRVLVLAATNLPWAIDEAARRRFVRRQYIPLPEDWVREKQLRTLLAAQKHNLSDRDLRALVQRTEGFSGSDITALAKDAAMGPLRSLGERLLHMRPEEIRPIGMEDFEKSLSVIRPSVSPGGLKEFEEWAREFGERGG